MQQTLPVIAVGDYNFDYDVASGDLGLPHRDGGFDAMIKDDKFRWIRPERPVKTEAADQFNSILDFVFVANFPFEWSAHSRILEKDGDQAATVNDFDDDDKQTDHRPLEASGFQIGASPKVAAECALIAWYDAAGKPDQPVVVEFRFRYGNDRGEYRGNVAQRAYAVFGIMERDLKDRIDFDGPTKTAYVYSRK